MERREPKNLPKIELIESAHETISYKKVGWLKKIVNKTVVQPWCWVNGKKTLIGAVVLAGGLVVGGQWGIVLKIVGTSLTTVGGLHKLGKITTKYGSKGEFGNKELMQLINDLIVLVVQLFKTIKAILNKLKKEK